MAIPSVAKLGHVGIYVNDLEGQRAFYRDVIGLTVSDEDLGVGLVFLSARPNEEHHEFLLARGREAAPDVRLVQQISFRCNSLEDVLAYYRRFRQHGVKIQRTVSHGNAVSIYFYDPEGNRCEVYWDTGLKAKQPYLVMIDLDTPPDRLMKEIEESVRKYGESGLINPDDLNRSNVRN
ncbi:MAG TPA: VOC family protein [Candidatus Binataceae bacterium]|nr:VOC family protein [Candidatus Binataceae bacterium]